MSEYRLKKLKKFLGEYNLSHILITDVASAEYISGFRSSNTLLLLSPRSNTLFTDFRYKEAAKHFCRKNKRWRFVELKGSDYTFLRAFLKRNDRIGIQSDVVTVDQFDKLKKQLRNVKFIKLGDKLSFISIVKMKHEIKAMQRAASIGDKAITILIKKIKIGMTERLVSDMLENLCRENGSDKPPFETIVLFGRRAALPHGKPSNRKLKPGDWILCDFGCTINGFTSDMTRTMVMGKANNRQKKIYSVVLKALQEAKKAVRPGIRACDIDKRARIIIEKAGYGDAFGHATGHGLGLRVHEPPHVNRDNKTTLLKDMIFTIEPGIYLEGFGGARIEDMVIVTENGSRSITKTTRGLLEINKLYNA